VTASGERVDGGRGGWPRSGTEQGRVEVETGRVGSRQVRRALRLPRSGPLDVRSSGALPARAGTTARPPRGRTRPAEHPRACGDDWRWCARAAWSAEHPRACGDDDPSDYGAPPRVRGRHPETSLLRSAIGAPPRVRGRPPGVTGRPPGPVFLKSQLFDARCQHSLQIADQRRLPF
jgi:hypothetical protein